VVPGQTANRAGQGVNARKFAPLLFNAPQNIQMNRKITTERRIGCHRLKPVEFEKCGTKTSRGPKHFTGPPRDKTDITQIKKIRQCKFVIFRFAKSQRKECQFECRRVAGEKQVVQERAYTEKKL
jgi:hypothetical protein